MGQANLEVRIHASDPVPMVATPDEGVSVNLEAYLYNPVTGKEVNVAGTTWLWSLVKADYSTDYDNYNTVWQGQNAPDWANPIADAARSSPDAAPWFSTQFDSITTQSPVLSSTFDHEGWWKITVAVRAAYPDNSTSPTTTRYPTAQKTLEFNVQERRLILLFGYWPPTNIGGMLNAFSTRQQYQDRSNNNTGYDVLAISPEFAQAIGTNTNGQNTYPYWGKGTNRNGADPLTVDYRATSESFWKLMAKYHPIAIMSFSRAYFNKKWTLEPFATNWANDPPTNEKWLLSIPFTSTVQGVQSPGTWERPYTGGSGGDAPNHANKDPSPYGGKLDSKASNPPDPTVNADGERSTSLPTLAIFTALSNYNWPQANDVEPERPLVSDIPRPEGPGKFVSNFMAFHVEWWQDYSNATWPNDASAKCLVAGHTHVGINVSAANGETAVRIQLDSIIQTSLP